MSGTGFSFCHQVVKICQIGEKKKKEKHCFMLNICFHKVYNIQLSIGNLENILCMHSTGFSFLSPLCQMKKHLLRAILFFSLLQYPVIHWKLGIVLSSHSLVHAYYYILGS
jgi:hypothetical protein